MMVMIGRVTPRTLVTAQIRDRATPPEAPFSSRKL